MKKILFTCILALGLPALAHAQATRTWVSGVGDDVNPCSRTAPCKTFAGAISKTASPGIINCLDPGGFGAVTITKSITIDCMEVFASVLSSGVQGIVINALTTDKVVLRNLDINGAGTTLGTNGISIVQAGTVHVTRARIANYSGNAIRAVNTSNAITVIVRDTEILDISGTCVLISPTGTGTARLDMSNSVVTKCGGQGVDIAGANNQAIITNSVLNENGGAGLQVQQTTSTGAVESSSLNFNVTGVVAGVAGNTPAVRLSRTMITGNNTNGVLGTTTCFSNNVISGNAGNNSCNVANQPQQ